MSKNTFGLVGQAREELVKRFLGRKAGQDAGEVSVPAAALNGQRDIPDAYCRFDRFPG